MAILNSKRLLKRCCMNSCLNYITGITIRPPSGYKNFKHRSSGKRFGSQCTIPSSTEETTSFVWEQIHLNMYTTHSYNKWHKTNLCCPLCTQPIRDEFHLVFHCPVVVSLWKEIESMLLRIYLAPVTEKENIWDFGGFPCGHLTELAYVCFAVLYLPTRNFGISQ